MSMKVQLQKSILVKALDRMCHVATKGLLPEYNFNGRLTIEVKKTKVVFTSSNGFITANCEISEDEDPSIKQNNDPGICTTDAIKIRDSVRKISVDDGAGLIELFDDGSSLVIRDANAKRKKVVKLPRESTHHKTGVVQQPDGDSSFFETEYFTRGVSKVLPFQSKAGYMLKYQMVCFHWTGNEARIICGDGMCFAIFTAPRNQKDKSKREIKRLIPCTQISIVQDLIGDSKEIELVWKQKEVLWIRTDNGVELIIRGIPDIDYIAYENNGFRFNEAKAYADLKVADIVEAADLLGVLRDRESEEQGRPHTCYLVAPSIDGHAKFEITSDQSKFQCEYEVPVSYYNLGTQPSFKSRYAHFFFSSPAHTARHPYLRFYLIGESEAVNVRDVDLGDPDANGIPVIKDEPDGCSLSFFFAPIKEESDD